MRLTWEQLCELLGINSQNLDGNSRYACRIYAALYSNHWMPIGYPPTGQGDWKYIGSFNPVDSLGSVQAAIGGNHEDVMDDEIWKDMEGK